jgi:hypothetical protein
MEIELNKNEKLSTEQDAPPIANVLLCAVPCYNCGSVEKDFYLVKGDHLLVDLDFPEKVEGEEIEIEICKNCQACQ